MKENFIKFVKANPSLVDYVKKNNTSWQDLYEIYALYGEDNDIWKKYLTNNGVDELINMIKGINLENIKKTTESLQKAVEIIQGLSGNKNSDEPYEKAVKYEDLDD